MTSGPDAAGAIELPGAPPVLPAVATPAGPTIALPTVLQVTPPKVTLPPLPAVTAPTVTLPKVTAPTVTTPKVTTPAVGIHASPGAGGGSSEGGGSTSGGGAPAAGDAAPAVGEPAAAGTAPARARAGTRVGRGAQEPAKQRRRRDRRLRRLVTNFSACLAALPGAERRVLTLRAGTGPGRPLSRRQVAARLGRSPRRVGRIERRGLRRLRAQARGGGCGTASPSVSAPASTPRVGAAPNVLAAFKTGATAAGRSAQSVGRQGAARSGVKGVSANSPGAALAPATVSGGFQRPPLAVLMLAAFLMGAGISWKLLAPPRLGRRRV